MKVLFAVSECVPFAKTGGLGDVAGALPKELKQLGTDIRVILPKYGTIPVQYRDKMKKEANITVQVGWRQQYCGIESLEQDGVTFYFIDNEYYFKRDFILYGHYDDGERFSFFCQAVLASLPVLDFKPDVIHSHDWHTGMISYLLKEKYSKVPFYEKIKTVFTIHNLQYQGVYPKEILPELFGLNEQSFASTSLEFYGNVNFMKAGIVTSNVVTTVSPTYKHEVQTSYYGEKLDGVLRDRKQSLVGILNGIDDQSYDPKNDPYITKNFDRTSIDSKVLNKQHLQEHFSLPVSKKTPIIAMVTRLTQQKGIDLLINIFHELMQEDIQLIVIGSGEHRYESFFNEMVNQYPDKCKAYIGFHEELARVIYAGADLFLMPSLFEPCGLGQLIAMRYGVIPIVRETGGLNDTVESFNEETMTGNGFTFTNYNAHDMLFTIRRALSYYYKTNLWNKLIIEVMNRDFSWAQSAFKYNQLYADLMTRSGNRVL
ncbi:glycogen synthase GlgA [Cytobacillus sp. IB215665]|uniref:glycogen synthase GlgA n=1 Tax=Cytobacillus sp. IB215665 TaxID=3097357 RepID=UPI002A101B3D|nr:glycogen synthase GlgA [Cytobacillus sp. IB215665]MDX8367399.1 glycogen synthase GlgA [Cytobacillus sp. IB215665]